jgi:antitoxin component of MazEF toxin-antitoxin module
MRTRIIRIGNSQGVRIPKLMLEQSGLADEVELEVRSDHIVIRAVSSQATGSTSDSSSGEVVAARQGKSPTVPNVSVSNGNAPPPVQSFHRRTVRSAQNRMGLDNCCHLRVHYWGRSDAEDMCSSHGSAIMRHDTSTCIAMARLVLKWNLEDGVTMTGRPIARVVRLIEELEAEGRL